jgi:hypothetical protein
VKDSRDDRKRGARSTRGHFPDRKDLRPSSHYRDQLPHRPFVETAFNRPIITTSNEPIFNQHQALLEMKREAERTQKNREAALEKQRYAMEMKLERKTLETEKMKIETEKQRLEMEKLKFELKQALAEKQKTKQVLDSIAHAPKSTSSSRNYVPSKEKRRTPPRAEVRSSRYFAATTFSELPPFYTYLWTLNFNNL